MRWGFVLQTSRDYCPGYSGGEEGGALFMPGIEPQAVVIGLQR